MVYNARAEFKRFKIMKFIKYIILLCVLCCASCSTTKDPAELYKGESPQEIFQKGEQALRNRDYSEATKRFEALEVQYPFGRETEIAQLHLIYSYYMTSEYASAECAAERFIHMHPANSHADYALYMRGLSNYFQNLGIFERFFFINLATRDLCQIKKSFADFSELVNTYPTSCYAASAQQYLIYLRNIIADYDLDIARYYLCREAYIAAANRATIIVRHYQGTPSVPDALVIMAQSYRRLNLTANYNEVLTVIKLNYPSYLNAAMS